jgi:hypothetical protein
MPVLDMTAHGRPRDKGSLGAHQQPKERQDHNDPNSDSDVIDRGHGSAAIATSDGLGSVTRGTHRLCEALVVSTAAIKLCYAAALARGPRMRKPSWLISCGQPGLLPLKRRRHILSASAGPFRQTFVAGFYGLRTVVV